MAQSIFVSIVVEPSPSTYGAVSRQDDAFVDEVLIVATPHPFASHFATTQLKHNHSVDFGHYLLSALKMSGIEAGLTVSKELIE